jgi:Fe-S cluster biogenesis protein NfuA
MQEIIDFINIEVNNDLKGDGGGCEFVSFIDGVVNIKLTGACKGCMMNTMTLKMGIERVAKERFPEIISVENINK